MFILRLFLILTLFTVPTFSKNYNEIVINGNKRISDETIKVFSSIPDNENLNENSINSILKNLYDTGFFKDVSVMIENNKLIINVKENPIIQTVTIDGVKKTDIKESIIDVLSLKDRSSFNKALLKEDEESILNLLKTKGYYFASITTTIEDFGNNKINLTHNIDIGKRAKISKISFIGDKKIKDNKLKAVIVSEEYKFWKFISGKKFLNEKIIAFDKQLLGNFYKNLGFYNVKIESSYANYVGNNEFELIYNISSGTKYFFNNLNLTLPADYDESNFNRLKEIFTEVKGKNYSLNTIDKILKEIDNIVLNKEFEFLSSTITEELDGDLINLTFNITDSEKFYVEKINIIGNNITREEVIRNSLFVDEGDPFNDLLHTKSINNIKSLNYFKNVKSEILPGTKDNQKIININVDEKPTGEISLGAGVGTAGSTVGFSLKENNFLGRGIQFGTDITMGSNEVKGLISMSDPNYKGSNKSLDFSIESSVNNRLDSFGYKSSKSGISLGSGYEAYEDFRLNIGVSSFIEDLVTDSTASTKMKAQKGSYFDTFFNYSLDYDKRDQRFQTTDGFRSTFSQNIPLISESYSLTNRYDYKYYSTWLKENVATIGFYGSTITSLTGGDVKLSERIHLPTRKLRGFEAGKLGPKDGFDYVGGNYALSFNLATTLPQILPSLQDVDFSLFYDAANVWGLDYSKTKSEGSKIRSSIGLAIDYFTPLGPLNFSFTEVLSQDAGDVTETFRFNLGTTF
jgi:outer membrane protein insertion porin family